MAAYNLTAYKGGNYLIPQHTFLIDELVMERSDLCLVQHLVKNKNGNLVRRYRLHTNAPTRFEDTLDYDIGCPHCNGRLRLCGRPYDYHDHGLYKCPACDKE